MSSIKERPLRLLVLGAHPDDADFHAGGLVSRYRTLGHTVKMVSATNGAAGHHQMPSAELAATRRGEAAAAAEIVGATYEVWEYPDGELEPTLGLRRRIIGEIRGFAPDLVVTHRPYDYHPDHRAVAQAVQDASFMVRVPKVVPELAALAQDPVVAYMPDLFTRPYPLAADVVVDITDQIDTIVAMLACHRSQVFEWLPYLAGRLDEIPADDQARLAWLRDWYTRGLEARTHRFRKEIMATYGPDHGPEIRYVEVYEISQYASPLDSAARQRLFPFVP